MIDVVKLKKEHRVVYCSIVDGLEIVFRPLTWRELDIYKRALSFGYKDYEDLYDEIFDLVVLDPLILDEKWQTPAGLVPTIARLVIAISGDIPEDNPIEKINRDLEEARQAVRDNIFEQFILTICKAFPSLVPRQIEDMEYPEILRLLMMAEQILEKEPIKLEKQQRRKDLTEQLMEDRRRAERVDSMKPSPQDIRDLLQPQEKRDLSYEMARQIEMVNRIKERNARG